MKRTFRTLGATAFLAVALSTAASGQTGYGTPDTPPIVPPGPTTTAAPTTTTAAAATSTTVPVTTTVPAPTTTIAAPASTAAPVPSGNVPLVVLRSSMVLADVSLGLPESTYLLSLSEEIARVLQISPSRFVTVRLGGFLSNSNVRLSAQSTPVKLGDFTADANGFIDVNTAIPDTVPAGDHHVVVQGTGADGLPLNVAIPVALAAPAQAAAEEPGNLALTGSDARRMFALSLVLIAVGAAGTVATRRRLRSPAN